MTWIWALGSSKLHVGGSFRNPGLFRTSRPLSPLMQTFLTRLLDPINGLLLAIVCLISRHTFYAVQPRLQQAPSGRMR